MRTSLMLRINSNPSNESILVEAYRSAGFDAVWRDPKDPARVATGFDLGDHMHGNDAGYRALTDSIDLGPFD
jgi:hypothetical protein